MVAQAPFTESLARSRDGVDVNVRVGGHGARSPLLLVCPPSASFDAFRHVAGYLGSGRRIASWDTRGLYGSPPLAERDETRLSAHVADAERALDAASFDSAAIVSWSLGAEVALELAFTRPERVRSLVLLSPVLGDTFARSLGLPQSSALRRAAVALRRAAPTAARLRSRVGAWPETEAWMRRLGLAADTLDTEVWRSLGEHLRDSDVASYVRSMHSLEHAPASGRLTDVTAPALVVVGDRDRYGSIVSARRLVRELPLGELFVVKEGTHYAHLEFPELVNLRVEKFLDGRAR